MIESPADTEIPKRALFKAAEVCELLKVQPYVLRSWESEFPELGVSKTPGSPRVYRRTDVEQVKRIKHLLLVEGLTLAGARRRLEEEGTPVAADAPLDELIGQNARDRLTEVKRGLHAILELLAGRKTGDDVRIAPRAATQTSRSASTRSAPTRSGSAGRVQPSRQKPAMTRNRTVARRKRSA
jgi:DNA-binding transcriptional MerR regulator